MTKCQWCCHKWQKKFRRASPAPIQNHSLSSCTGRHRILIHRRKLFSKKVSAPSQNRNTGGSGRAAVEAMKARTVSSDLHIRITKLKTLTLLQKVYDSKSEERKKINTIINEALELALPCMLDNTSLDTIDKTLERHTGRILSQQYKHTEKILSQLTKLSILLITNEQMVSSVLQELEFFLLANGIKIPEELLSEFKDNLPERFEKDKEILIEKLIKKIDN